MHRLQLPARDRLHQSAAPVPRGATTRIGKDSATTTTTTRSPTNPTAAEPAGYQGRVKLVNPRPPPDQGARGATEMIIVLGDPPTAPVRSGGATNEGVTGVAPTRCSSARLFFVFHADGKVTLTARL
ncbi:hypothetical protein GCM10022204_41800 [Microlunatus aurantiacus]|uniref:Uncharacterized protein n=1 Tax=Microlunatus aurantiacus TaxID=446786 RepID=A0ABP7ED71_9ACTN